MSRHWIFRCVPAAVVIAVLSPLVSAAGAGLKLELREGGKLRIELEVPSGREAKGATGRFVYHSHPTVCEGDLHQGDASTSSWLVLHENLSTGSCRPRCAYELSADLLSYRENCEGHGVIDQGRFSGVTGETALDAMRAYVAALPPAKTATAPVAGLPKESRPVEALLRFDGLKLVKPTPEVAELGLKYIIEQGQIDPRMLYPSRIAQQVPETLKGWSDALESAYERGRVYAVRNHTLYQLNMSVGLLYIFSKSDPSRGRLMAKLADNRERLYALVGLMGKGDQAAIDRYRALALGMAEDSFVQELFAAATMKRALNAELDRQIDDKTTDPAQTWRLYAVRSILNASDRSSADEAWQAVQSDARKKGAADALVVIQRSEGRRAGQSQPAQQGSGWEKAEERVEPRRCVAWRDIRGAPKVWTDADGNVHVDAGEMIGTECTAWSR